MAVEQLGPVLELAVALAVELGSQLDEVGLGLFDGGHEPVLVGHDATVVQFVQTRHEDVV